MRPDMARVIVERPRVGGRGPRKGVSGRLARDLAAEREPKLEGMRPKKIIGGRKSLNENLSPLYKWLDRQVGRPWDRVYSEMRARIDVRSAVQLHIAQHVVGRGNGDGGHVLLHVDVAADGRVCRPNRGWKSREAGYDELNEGDLFVHPTTGLLRKYRRNGRRERYEKFAARYPQPEKTNQNSLVTVSSKLCYRRKGAVWFELTLAPMPKELESRDGVQWGKRVLDVWSETNVSLRPAWGMDARAHGFVEDTGQRHLYGNGLVYCVAKRQLGGVEAKKLGLGARAA